MTGLCISSRLTRELPRCRRGHGPCSMSHIHALYTYMYILFIYIYMYVYIYIVGAAEYTPYDNCVVSLFPGSSPIYLCMYVEDDKYVYILVALHLYTCVSLQIIKCVCVARLWIGSVWLGLLRVSLARLCIGLAWLCIGSVRLCLHRVSLARYHVFCIYAYMYLEAGSVDLLHVHQEILAWLAYGTGQLGCFFIWWSIELKDIYSVVMLAQVYLVLDLVRKSPGLGPCHCCQETWESLESAKT